MKKSDNYGSLWTLMIFLVGVLYFVFWVKTEDIECLVLGAFFTILAHISMAIITIKKYIDKVFENKVNNIQVDEQSNDLLDAREYFLQGLGKEVASKCGVSAEALGLDKEVKEND